MAKYSYRKFQLLVHDNISYYTLLGLTSSATNTEIMERITYLENICFPRNSLNEKYLKQWRDLCKIRQVLQHNDTRVSYLNVHHLANYVHNKNPLVKSCIIS